MIVLDCCSTMLEMTARVVHVWDTEDGRVVNLEQFTDTKPRGNEVTPADG